MRVISRITAAAGALALAAVLPVSAASAAEVTGGCTGKVTSMSADGSVLSVAEFPGPGGTQADPLIVDPKGTILWEGSTPSSPSGGTWSVTSAGVPLPQGNVGDTTETTKSGTYNVADAPAALSWVFDSAAIVPAEGTITWSGGSCTATGFVAGNGQPMSSPVFLAGSAIAATGAVLAAWVLLGTKAAGAAAAAGGAA
jgi:hypothetical protein